VRHTFYLFFGYEEYEWGVFRGTFTQPYALSEVKVGLRGCSTVVPSLRNALIYWPGKVFGVDFLRGVLCECFDLSARFD
jgi:hypothetical protein